MVEENEIEKKEVKKKKRNKKQDSSDSDSEEKMDRKLIEKENEKKKKAKEALKAAEEWTKVTIYWLSFTETIQKANSNPSVVVPDKKKKTGGGEAFRRVDGDLWGSQILEGLEDNSCNLH